MVENKKAVAVKPNWKAKKKGYGEDIIFYCCAQKPLIFPARMQDFFLCYFTSSHRKMPYCHENRLCKLHLTSILPKKHNEPINVL